MPNNIKLYRTICNKKRLELLGVKDSAKTWVTKSAPRRIIYQTHFVSFYLEMFRIFR